MISNSSPLIFLAKINRLDIMKKLFNKIIIPTEVKEEILMKDSLDSKIISRAIEEEWINISPQQKSLDLNLGKGENAAISLAKEKNDSLMIDDSQGVKAAASLNIKTIRTTTIILMALKKKIITKKEAINLINKIVELGYYIAPEHYSSLLTKLVE